MKLSEKSIDKICDMAWDARGTAFDYIYDSNDGSFDTENLAKYLKSLNLIFKPGDSSQSELEIQ